MKTTRTIVTLLALAGTVGAQDLLQSDAPNLGGIIFPSFHATAAVGDASRDPADLASHAHDPNDDFTLQGIDVGFSVIAGDYFQAFANQHFFIDLEDDWDSEFEEGFIKLVNLPGGLEFRGGRMFNRVGRQNSTHQHGWDFVDANLILTRMLGDEGLLTNSAEITWNLPTPFESAFSVGFGETVPHEEHAHGEEEHHDEDEEEEEEEHELEGEEGLWDTDVLSLRYDALWNYNDFHQYRFGATVIMGKNHFGRDTNAYGVDVQYTFRENGLEPGGRYVRVSTEVMSRDVEYQHEDGDERGSFSELGVAAMILYGFAEDWEAGVRYGWVEGSDELHELPERYRLSVALTRRFQYNDHTSGWVRLQANHEDHEEFGDESSIWLQFGFDWGGPEIR